MKNKVVLVIAFICCFVPAGCNEAPKSSDVSIGNSTTKSDSIVAGIKIGEKRENVEKIIGKADESSINREINSQVIITDKNSFDDGTSYIFVYSNGKLENKLINNK